ncbi:MAG: hypothetical protein U9P49_01885 [Thermodesulfobacteriota bacterium]|nr:hypothetical protein [Thermodesulfobacteriota bacterium]
MDSSLFYLLIFFAGHVGLSGKGIAKVGWIQYLLHKGYAILEPTILRVVDYILSIKLMTETTTGRRILRLIALLSWLFPHGIVVTTEAAERVVDFITKTEVPNGARLAVGPCVCQKALHRWEEPSCKDMVVLYGAEIYTHLKLGYRLIPADEAKKMLRAFNEAGLVHELDFCMQSGRWTFVICNCESKICVLTRVFLLTREFLYPGPEIVSHDPKLCIGVEKCGHCIERCIFDANIIAGDKVDVDLKKCMGCGLCVSTCSGKARSMVRRKDYSRQDTIPEELLLGDQ